MGARPVDGGGAAGGAEEGLGHWFAPPCPKPRAERGEGEEQSRVWVEPREDFPCSTTFIPPELHVPPRQGT